MDDRIERLHELRDATTREELLNALWTSEIRHTTHRSHGMP